MKALAATFDSRVTFSMVITVACGLCFVVTCHVQSSSGIGGCLRVGWRRIALHD